MTIILCDVCGAYYESASVGRHTVSSRHTAALKKAEASKPKVVPYAPGYLMYCILWTLNWIVGVRLWAPRSKKKAGVVVVEGDEEEGSPDALLAKGKHQDALTAFRAVTPPTDASRLGAAVALYALDRKEECRDMCLPILTPVALALRAAAEVDMGLLGPAVTSLCALRDMTDRNEAVYDPVVLQRTFLAECDSAASSLKGQDTSELKEAWPQMPLWCEGTHKAPADRVGILAKGDASAKSAWRYWHKSNAKMFSELGHSHRCAMVDFAVRYACDAVTRDGFGVPVAVAVVLGGRAWEILGRGEYRMVCTVVESVHDCESCHYHTIDPSAASALNPAVVVVREDPNDHEPETVEYASGSVLLGAARRMLLCEALVVLSQCAKFEFSQALLDAMGPVLRQDIPPVPKALADATEALQTSMGFALDGTSVIGAGAVGDFDILLTQ